MRKLKIMISGGGTGGHIFPAIAIAEALKQKFDDIDILFVGALGRMEMEKVPLAGFPIKGLWISGIQRKFSAKNLIFPFKLIFSLIKAAGIISKFKPNAVVGVGGYASGPTVKMALRKNIPALLQEQNSFPGITNKWLAKDVEKICVAYQGMEKFFPKEKLILTGNPIRKSVTDIEGKKQHAAEYFELDKNKFTILVIGGSQGARSINESISKNLDLLAMNDLQIIWQTGKGYTEQAHKNILGVLNGNKKSLIKVCDFISRMDLAYAAADMVISRAGAISISELSAVGKACILIPLPSAAEDHQTKNAMALAKQNAAIHLKDADAKDKLGKIAIDLAKDPKQRDLLSRNIKTFEVLDSADRIADEIIKICKTN